MRAATPLYAALLAAALFSTLAGGADAKKSAPGPGQKLKQTPLSALGSISVGRPNAGFLLNAVRLHASPDWVVTAPSHAYGTEETLDQLEHCVHQVRTRFPGSPAVMLGSISKREGGAAPPHKSHRTGRDADVYFFRKPGSRWYEAATSDDIDLPRTWALLRCFVSEADVDFVLIERKVQPWLEDYAIDSGEPRQWVESLFHDGPGAHRAVVRHAPGHVAHMHVRFVSPKARQLAITYYARLVAEGRIKGGAASLKHTVKSGETLGLVAKKYKTSVDKLLKYNQLKSTVIHPGQVLSVSRAVPLEGVKDPIQIPARRVPPQSASSRSASMGNATDEANNVHPSLEATDGDLTASRSELWQTALPF